VTLSIKGLFATQQKLKSSKMTLSIIEVQHNNTLLLCAECRYAECHYGECCGAKVATETDATSMTQNLSYKPFWGTQKPTGENLKVPWAKLSTLS
jgi:hypothetical protein